MKTIKEVSAITGLSIRTLRYYDEIGLLKPTKLTEAGYRLYDSRALEKLQEILFFRELEIPLGDIKKILDNPSLDKEQILLAQKSMLEKKRNRLDSIIELITDRMKGVNTMSFSEFNKNDVTMIIEKMKKELSEEQFNQFMKEYGGGSVEAYQKKLEQDLNEENNKASLLKWYGSKEKVIEGYAPVQNMEELRKAFDELLREFSAHIGCAGDDREHEMVAELADLYKQMLNMDNARNWLLDLAGEYLQNGKIAKVQDEQYGKGTTRYMAEAIQRYYGV
ncbi:MAG: MerR family transcriptional regulator [Lachnospiraceae bacterium]|nr:MerR family transcriptional regulator [Lachnospiraceae bacterium]